MHIFSKGCNISNSYSPVFLTHVPFIFIDCFGFSNTKRISLNSFSATNPRHSFFLTNVTPKTAASLSITAIPTLCRVLGMLILPNPAIYKRYENLILIQKRLQNSLTSYCCVTMTLSACLFCADEINRYFDIEWITRKSVG